MKYLTIALLSAAIIPLSVAQAHSANDFHHPAILKQPIAGVKNNFWYDYLSDIREAEHELRKDLARATDAEDRADARKNIAMKLPMRTRTMRRKCASAAIAPGTVSIVRKLVDLTPVISL